METNDQVMRASKSVSLAHVDCGIGTDVKYLYEEAKHDYVNREYFVFADSTVFDTMDAIKVFDDLFIRRHR